MISSLVPQEESDAKAAPFLKWAGGKRWLIPIVAPLLHNPRGGYIEPFLGGGSIFFSTTCQHAILSDVNLDLVNTYRIVRNSVEDLILVLRCLKIGRRLFSRIRREPSCGEVARAARFIYLNKTAYNGLFRVNQEGSFNVPFGCKRRTQLCEADRLRICSQSLQKAALISADFRFVLEHATDTDTVFIDPPYTVKHDNNGFRRYNERIFSWDDQLDLSKICNRLARRGVRVVITNAFHNEVRALYQRNLFRAYALSRCTNMAARTDARGKCSELLLVSKALPDLDEVPELIQQPKLYFLLN